jgi:hypothetical protein
VSTTSLKFLRNYEIGIQVSQDPTQDLLVVQPPLTLVFDITKDYLSSSSSATFQLYNLKALNRNQIRRNINDVLDVRTIALKAGYGNNIAVCFNGMMQQAFSYRDGVDDITQIEAMDWSFAFISPDADYSGSFAAGTTQQQVLSDIISKALPNVQVGTIGNGYSQKFNRPTSHAGMSKDLLMQYTGGQGTSGFFIDNGVANIVGKTEALAAKGIGTINTNFGLLNKPIQEASVLHFDMLFEPRLLMAQAINLVSVTEPQLNGQYKVISIKHHGMISDAVCGEAITTVGLYSPTFPPTNDSFTIIGLDT